MSGPSIRLKGAYNGGLEGTGRKRREADRDELLVKGIRNIKPCLALFVRAEYSIKTGHRGVKSAQKCRMASTHTVPLLKLFKFATKSRTSHR